jgi:hypothetical protein
MWVLLTCSHPLTYIDYLTKYSMAIILMKEVKFGCENFNNVIVPYYWTYMEILVLK